MSLLCRLFSPFFLVNLKLMEFARHPLINIPLNHGSILLLCSAGRQSLTCHACVAFGTERGCGFSGRLESTCLSVPALWSLSLRDGDTDCPAGKQSCNKSKGTPISTASARRPSCSLSSRLTPKILKMSKLQEAPFVDDLSEALAFMANVTQIKALLRDHPSLPLGSLWIQSFFFSPPLRKPFKVQCLKVHEAILFHR